MAAITQNVDALMQPAWFPDSTPISARTPFNDATIRDISTILRNADCESWSHVPRIYIVLRTINQSQLVDAFIDDDLTDLWFPFTRHTLPRCLPNDEMRADFLLAQHLVLTKALDLEKENGAHRHFQDPEDIPFIQSSELGRGGFGVVHKVQSTISHKEYARKSLVRGLTFRRDKKVLEEFENELATMKRVSHRHIVKFVGSYTDPTYVGIIMSPVADCDLQHILSRPRSEESDSLLRASLGCLTAAVAYLHSSRIRHKDIKPRNILVKNDQVLLTDFGISRDWTQAGHSTTTGSTVKTEKYCAPEVAQSDGRNTSSDIWSLGCVFLEIWSILCGTTLEALDRHMKSSGTKSVCYHNNTEGVRSWTSSLPSCRESMDLERPKIWLSWMLETDQAQRCTAAALFEAIGSEEDEDTMIRYRHHFVGTCCLPHHEIEETVASSVPGSTTSSRLPLRGSSALRLGRNETSRLTQAVNFEHLVDSRPLAQESTIVHASQPWNAVAEIGTGSQPTLTWRIDEAARGEFGDVFDSMVGTGTQDIKKDQAMAFFRNTRLRSKELNFLCSLVGPPNQDSFDRDEFAVVMQLIRCRLAGFPIPSRLPAELLATLNQAPTSGDFDLTARDSPTSSVRSPSLSQSGSSDTRVVQPGLNTVVSRHTDIALLGIALPNMQAITNKCYDTKLPLLLDSEQRKFETRFRDMADGRLSVSMKTLSERKNMSYNSPPNPSWEDLRRARYNYPQDLIRKFEFVAQLGAGKLETLFPKKYGVRFTFFEYCLWFPFHANGGQTDKRPAFLIDFLHWSIDSILGKHGFGEENPVQEPIVKMDLEIRILQVVPTVVVSDLPLAACHPEVVYQQLESLLLKYIDYRTAANFRYRDSGSNQNYRGLYSIDLMFGATATHRLYMAAAFGRRLDVQALLDPTYIIPKENVQRQRLP